MFGGEVQLFDLSAAHELELRNLGNDGYVSFGELRPQMGKASATEATPAHKPPPSTSSVGAVDAKAIEREVRKEGGASGRPPPRLPPTISLTIPLVRERQWPTPAGLRE